MKFIVDAQLPEGIAWILNNRGYNAIHTNQLPNKERTTDTEIGEISKLENRIVVTKDYDFVDSHFIKNIPKKLLLISTGNIRNSELFNLFSQNIQKIIELLGECDFVEMSNSDIIGYN